MRKSPDVWKTRFILHLQEFVQVLADQCDSTATQTRHFLNLRTRSDEKPMSEICKLLAQCTKKIHRASSDFSALAETLTEIKATAMEQLELSRSVSNGVITALVAVYVPLSFVSVCRRRSHGES